MAAAGAAMHGASRLEVILTAMTAARRAQCLCPFETLGHRPAPKR